MVELLGRRKARRARKRKQVARVAPSMPAPVAARTAESAAATEEAAAVQQMPPEEQAQPEAVEAAVEEAPEMTDEEMQGWMAGGCRMTGDWFTPVEQFFKRGVTDVTKAVTTPVKGIVSAVTEPAGQLVKTTASPIWGIAVAGTVGLLGYLLITGKLKMPKSK